jgi:hypothetical protein
MGYLNKTCSYTSHGKIYTGTIIGERGEDLLVITVAPFAHNHTTYSMCIKYGFVLSIDKDEYIKKSKEKCFYFIKIDQIESLLTSDANVITIIVDEDNKLSVAKK